MRLPSGARGFESLRLRHVGASDIKLAPAFLYCKISEFYRMDICIAYQFLFRLMQINPVIPVNRKRSPHPISAIYRHLVAVMDYMSLKRPEDCKRIIDITYRFSSGWRRVYNPITGRDVADDLTTTEFAIAMFAARGWTNLEIAKHLNISANTVKDHISETMRKLRVET